MTSFQTFLKVILRSAITISLCNLFITSIDASDGVNTHFFEVIKDDQIIVEQIDVPTSKLVPSESQSLRDNRDLYPKENLGPYTDKDDLVEKLEYYLVGHRDYLPNGKLSHLKLKDVRQLEDKILVEWIQHRKNVPVEGASLLAIIHQKENKEMIFAGLLKRMYELKGLENTLTQPSRSSMIVQAAQEAGLDPRTQPVHSEELIRCQDDCRYIEQITFKAPTEGRDLNRQIMIEYDSRTGEYTQKETGRYASMQLEKVSQGSSKKSAGSGINGNVLGNGVLTGPIGMSEEVELPIRNLKLSIDATGYHDETFTDTLGDYQFSNPPTNSTLSTAINSTKWLTLYDVNPYQGFSFGVSPQGTYNLLFNDQSGGQTHEGGTEQVTTVYHMSVVHDYVKDNMPLNTCIDYAIPTYINVSASGTSGWIGFYENKTIYLREELTYGNLKSPSGMFDQIIYHEYGHFMDDCAGGINWGSLAASSLAEGIAQTLPGYTAAEVFSPMIDNNFYYPFPNIKGDDHDIGDSLSGFNLDLRREMISQYGQQGGVEIAEKLFFGAVAANTGTIPDFLLSLILIDDNDGNITNGTPHLNEILMAASKHGLYPFGNENGLEILSPGHDDSLSGHVTIDYNVKVEVPSDMEFVRGVIQVCQGPEPSPLEGDCQTLATLESPTTNGTVVWDSSQYESGTYSIRMLKTDKFIQTGYELNFQRWIAVHVDGTKFESLHNPSPTAIRVPKPYSRDTAIDGNVVAWFDNTDVLVHEMGTTNILKIGNDSYKEFITLGDQKVYYGRRDANDNYNIYYYDYGPSGSGAIYGLWNDNSQRHPSANENWIVMQNNTYFNEGNWNIGMFDVVNQTFVEVTNDSFDQTHPDISKDYIVWQSNQNGNEDIYLVERSNLFDPIQITSSQKDEIRPSVAGNVITWSEDNSVGEDADIFYCIFNSQTKECPIVQLTHKGNQMNPRTNGQVIVWEDWSRPEGQMPNPNIVYYDLDHSYHGQMNRTPFDSGHNLRVDINENNDIFYFHKDFGHFPMPAVMILEGKNINSPSCGDVISNSIVLKKPLMNCPSYGLEIEEGSNDIVVDCAGHTISGDNNGVYGLYAKNANNITIIDCPINKYSFGIKMENVNNVTIEDAEIKETVLGVFIDGATNVVLNHNHVHNNEYGIVIYETDPLSLEDNTIVDNEFENVQLDSCYDFTLANNSIKRGALGLGIYTSADGNITGNSISSNEKGITLDTGVENVYLSDNVVCLNQQGSDIENFGIDNGGQSNRCNGTENYHDEGLIKGCHEKCIKMQQRGIVY